MGCGLVDARPNLLFYAALFPTEPTGSLPAACQSGRPAGKLHLYCGCFMNKARLPSFSALHRKLSGDLPHIKRHLVLAWPISLELLLVNLVGVIDVMMVGSLGDAAIAAIGIASKIIFVLILILVGCGSTVGLLAAQYYGGDRLHKVRNVVLLGGLLGVVLSLIASVISLFAADRAIAFFTTDPETIRLGGDYMRIVVPSMMMLALIMVFENALRSLGQVKVSLTMSASAVVFNIVLNYWFIFGGLGVPPLGVVGAALGTLMARTIHLGLFLVFFYVSKHEIRFQRKDLQNFLVEADIPKFLRLALPAVGGFAIWSFGILAYQYVFGHMGTQAIAVVTLVHAVEGVLMSVFVGLAIACSIIVGQHLGAGDFAQAHRDALRNTVLMPLASLIIGLIIIVGNHLILALFFDLPADTRNQASVLLMVMGLLHWLKVVNLTIALGVLRAGGRNMTCLVTDAIGMWGVGIPLVFIAGLLLQWPLVLVFLMTFSEEVCKLFIYVHHFRKGAWQRRLD
jgi:putative MATE family efflux protein